MLKICYITWYHRKGFISLTDPKSVIYYLVYNIVEDTTYKNLNSKSCLLRKMYINNPHRDKHHLMKRPWNHIFLTVFDERYIHFKILPLTNRMLCKMLQYVCLRDNRVYQSTYFAQKKGFQKWPASTTCPQLEWPLVIFLCTVILLICLCITH